MPKLFFTCKYCNKQWDEYVYAPSKSLRCPVCGDRNIKVKQDPPKGNYFGYEDEPQLNPEDAWIGNDD